MKLAQTLLALAIAGLAGQSQATISFTVTNNYPLEGNGLYQPPSTYSMPDPTNWRSTPYGKDIFMGIYPNNPLTLNLNGAETFSYAWGWPDGTNTVTIDGQTFTEAQMYNGYEGVTFTSDKPMWQVTFTQTSYCCFEVGFAPDWLGPSAVPEPQTYALLTGGLGLIAWRQRRQVWK